MSSYLHKIRKISIAKTIIMAPVYVVSHDSCLFSNCIFSNTIILYSSKRMFSNIQRPALCVTTVSKWSKTDPVTPESLLLCTLYFPLRRPEVTVKSEQREKLNSHPLQQRRQWICFPPQFSSKQKKHKQRREKRRGIAGEEREERKRHGDHF